MAFNGNPFVDISREAPLGRFKQQAHPLQAPTANNGRPIHTNKFYTNLLIGDQTLQTWVQPYSLWWSKAPNFCGMAVSHTKREQFVFGPDANAPSPQFYFSPVGILSMLLSATEFDNGATFQVDESSDLHCRVSLGSNCSDGRLSIPLVQGMGFVTGIYNGLRPKISSQVGIESVVKLIPPKPTMLKYQLTLCNGVKWLMYVTIPRGVEVPTFYLTEKKSFVANFAGQGYVIQLATAPDGTERYYDQAAGRYLVGASITGDIYDNGARGIYRIQYEAEGSSLDGKPLVFAAPHHVASLTGQMKAKRTGIELDSTNMGKLTGYLSTVIEMNEVLPINIGFSPYSSFKASSMNIGQNERSLIGQVATNELQQANIANESNLNSMYFSGKKLDKYAQILFTCKYILRDDNLARSALEKLKEAFGRFASNNQQFPLVYDTTWKGLISVAGLNGDALQDFGNSFYNDHNFHYGYFIHAAAVIGQVDKEFGGNWVAENRDFVNNLVRDVANPSSDDLHFPRWRSFDWYAGHSWAKGIMESADGKDQESSSEDFHFAYGMKLWGRVLNDGPMESRANLMLAVLKRSMNTYMYYKRDNSSMPPQILSNKVSGILFENKVDYATWFSARTECKHGIHMIPVTSVSSYIRQADYVREEWEEKLASIVDSIDDGWKGILYQNKALFDPASSYAFFAQPNFDNKWLDDGMSRTWSLAFPACFLSC